jgi:hypothetical protein
MVMYMKPFPFHIFTLLPSLPHNEFSEEYIIPLPLSLAAAENKQN